VTSVLQLQHLAGSTAPQPPAIQTLIKLLPQPQYIACAVTGCSTLHHIRVCARTECTDRNGSLSRAAPLHRQPSSHATPHTLLQTHTQQIAWRPFLAMTAARTNHHPCAQQQSDASTRRCSTSSVPCPTPVVLLATQAAVHTTLSKVVQGPGCCSSNTTTCLCQWAQAGAPVALTPRACNEG
jgi:hypothetical protein